MIGRKYYQDQNKNCSERFHEDLPLIEENKRERINLKTEGVFVEESFIVNSPDRRIQPRMGVLAKLVNNKKFMFQLSALYFN